MNVIVNSRTSGTSRIVFLSLAAVCAIVLSMLISSGRALATVDPVKGIEAANLVGFDGCADDNDDPEWHFVITQVSDEAHAPATITVEWANGDVQIIARSNFTGGVAHFFYFGNLDSTVVSATAVIYSDWDGQFRLSHAPCNEVTPTPEIPTETPTNTPSETPTEVATETPTEVATETPPAEVTETVEVTETIGGEEETPVPSATATTEPTDPTATSEPVEELPNTGTNPGSTGTSGMLAAALLAIVLAGAGLMLRRRTVHAGR
jgi:hypothetical protein